MLNKLCDRLLLFQGKLGGEPTKLRPQNSYFCFRKKARRAFSLFVCLKNKQTKKPHRSHYFPHHSTEAFLHSPATGSWSSLRSWLLGTKHLSPPSRVISPSLICQQGPVVANAFMTSNQAGEDHRRAKLIRHKKQISTIIIFGHYFHKLDLNWWPPAGVLVLWAPQFPSIKALVLTSDFTHVSALPLPVTLRPSIDIWLNRYPSSTSFLVAKCPVGLHKSTQQERSSWVSCLRSRITSNS